VATLEKIRDYLSEHSSAKVKDIATSLGCTRKSVNSILYYNSAIFNKNTTNQWTLENTTDNLPVRKAQEVFDPEPLPENTIIIENIDLVERTKDLLKQHVLLKVRDIAEQLDEPRAMVTRTLHSFQNVFEKGDDNEWFIRLDYIDSSTGPDADFTSIETVLSVGAQLPALNFKEEDKPPQQTVIEATLDRNFLVLAPPGTGKTHTLIERLVYAITTSFREVDAGELLVLSFTRAAVGEIRDRIAKAIANGAPSSLRYVQVRTFDAYATWLLNDGSYDIVGKTYDARIALLTEALNTVNLRQATDRIGRSRYLFVDEIQDLVGVRADMVFELVKRILSSKGSVTLLGDPHQSLNDYQIKDNQTDSAEFLEKVQSHLAGGLERFELEESHRYETPEMKLLATNAKKVLDNGGVTPKDKFNQLVQLIPEITQEQLIKNFKEGSTDALLCRSNGEVFQWFNWHQEQSNPCTVNAGAIGRPWPAWIGQAIMHFQPKVMTRDQLLNRLFANVDDGLTPSEEEFDEFLFNERLMRRNSVSLEDLAFRLKYLSPAKKGDEADDGLIVSTVHKAKGLEYKSVVVVEPRPNKKKGVTDEEVRVLYVAITRAKRSISLLPKNATPFSGWITKKKGGHLGYAEDDIKYLQVIGLEDFALESLFFNEQGGVDISNLENYLLTYQEENHYSIRPESFNGENDHNYALYLNSSLGPVRLCAISKKMTTTLNAMAWGNKYGEDGALLDMGEGCSYQTIVHPMQSHILARHIGPAGIMVFPLIQGFYPLSRVIGE
jgi:superfamily I DNA/RNA helicase